MFFEKPQGGIRRKNKPNYNVNFEQITTFQNDSF